MAGAKKSNGVVASQPAVNTSTAGTTNGTASTATTVNRKKQKRREKQAARLAAEQGTQHKEGMNNGHPPQSSAYQMSHYHEGMADVDSDDPDYGRHPEADTYYSDEEAQTYQTSYDAAGNPINGNMSTGYLSAGDVPGRKSKKKRKAKGVRSPDQASHPHLGTNHRQGFHAPPPPPPPPQAMQSAPVRSANPVSRDRIWNASAQEERERIKEFWLSLGEEDRRSLVKVEKEAVLRKMKEQQKHSCSCTVCGRKRTAIEEELEVLYDAYYEELEQYAYHQTPAVESPSPMMGPPRRYGPMGRMQPADGQPGAMGRRLPGGHVEELPEDDDEADEDYSDEEEDEDYSDDEAEEIPRGPAADFFNFGNSLTVQGGILTVAEDLLKNDGKKFIEMMEQLAERRMQREEEAKYAAHGLAHPSMGVPGQHGPPGHNHPPQAEEDDYEDDEEDDYDSQEEEDYDDDELDTMTEEQRMEEGRRMFQIFAARMFEQRVFTAYKEMVAQERQRTLLEELEEENRLDVQREQKKAKEAQKKKDKKRQQKQAKDEEKARKEAEKAAEEAALRAIEEKKAEEQRQKKEEQRKKREAEKKAQEDERLRKEAEKQRRLQEERERQAEIERKQREAKERERKKKEDAKKKERDEREAKEREAREKKERAEKERKERADKARMEKEAREQKRKEEQAAQQAAVQAAHNAVQSAKRPSQTAAVPPPPGLHSSAGHVAAVQSPHLQIATPAIPKAPTPIRARQASQQASQQGSVASSPRTPQLASGQGQSTSPSNPAVRNSPGPIIPPGRVTGQQPPLHHPQPTSATIGPPPGMLLPSTSSFPSMPAAGPPLMPASQPQRNPISHETIGFGSQHMPPLGPPPQQPPYQATMGHQFPPNMHPPLDARQNPPVQGPRPGPQGRGMYVDSNPGLSQQPVGLPHPSSTYNMPRDTMPSHSHSRHQSASFDKPSFEHPQPSAPTQPIARPAPIQRPASANRNRVADGRRTSKNLDVDDLSHQLGSSALLDDTDDQLPPDAPALRRGSAAPGPPPSTRSRFPFGASSMFSHSMGQNKMEGLGLSAPGPPGDSWAAPHTPFGLSTMPGTSTWSNNSGWSSNHGFGIIGGPNRSGLSRPVNVRLLICQACKQLSTSKPPGDSGFHEISNVLRHIDGIRPGSEPPVQMREFLDICDTEGDAQNGGGMFVLTNDERGEGRTFIKHEMSDHQRGFAPGSTRGSVDPGEIGSPISGQAMPASFGGAAGARGFSSSSAGHQTGIPAPSGF
ncbi:MAG: Stress response protein nst1 [Caeruleum heppii]|nr:MAG: Stress response protein nst1 [Caeruleum heppii]